MRGRCPWGWHGVWVELGTSLDAVHCGSQRNRSQVNLLGMQFLNQVVQGLRAFQAAGVVHVEMRPLRVLSAKKVPSSCRTGCARGSTMWPNSLRMSPRAPAHRDPGLGERLALCGARDARFGGSGQGLLRAGLDGERHGVP